MKISKPEFDQAVERLRLGRAGIETDIDQCVFVAACLIMRQRRQIPDDQPWAGPTNVELALFLGCLDGVRRNRVRRIAETM